MKTTWLTTLLLVMGLMLAGCTIQPAVPVAEPTADTAAAADATDASRSIASPAADFRNGKTGNNQTNRAACLQGRRAGGRPRRAVSS